MKRKTKNIIIITLIIILGIASRFTVKLAKDSVSINSENVGQTMGTPPDKPDGSNGMPTENMQSQSRKEIDIEYYILFGVEAFLISLLIAFLIMSNFNKKTIAMTLSGAKNIVILVVIVAILTAVLTVTQGFIANKLIETNQTQSQSGMQAPNGMQMPGGNEAKSITLKLDSTSKIKLTGDSYVTSLEDADATYSNIDFNGYKLYVNGVAIN